MALGVRKLGFSGSVHVDSLAESERWRKREIE